MRIIFGRHADFFMTFIAATEMQSDKLELINI